MNDYKTGDIYCIDSFGTHIIYEVTKIDNKIIYYKPIVGFPVQTGSFSRGSFNDEESYKYNYEIPVVEFSTYVQNVISIIRKRRLFPQDTNLSLKVLYNNFKKNTLPEKVKYINK